MYLMGLHNCVNPGEEMFAVIFYRGENMFRWVK